MGASTEFVYVGDELELFAKAVNWKSYWARSISPYIGSKVLDVGAGIGATAKVLCSDKQARWVSIEPDRRLSDQMRDSQKMGSVPAKCEVRTGTLSDLDKNEKFDTILYIDVLEHIEDDIGELQRASEYLEEGGCIIMVGPAHNWLFTPFDEALGHFRRYDKKVALKSTPTSLKLDRYFYLDSVGMLASLGNKLVLQSAHPKENQIRLWDRVLVPASRLLDPLMANAIGKSMVAVWRKK